jgi:hypothetical protein
MLLKPRKVIWSRWPSPTEKPMPGTLRNASCNEVAFCSSSSARGTTLTVCGTSISDMFIFVAVFEVLESYERSAAALTAMAGRVLSAAPAAGVVSCASKGLALARDVASSNAR